MSRRKTHEEFSNEVYQKLSNIEFMSKYTTRRDRIKCKCTIDNHEWEPFAYALLKGEGCPECALRKRTKSHDDFVSQLKHVNENISVIGKYSGLSRKVLCHCEICSDEFEKWPGDLLDGSGCPRCSGRHVPTNEEFVERVRSVNDTVYPIDEYAGAAVKIMFGCKVCGGRWETKPSHIFSGHGCPNCRSSVGEKSISDYLTSRGIYFEPQKRFNNCRYKHTLPFDFYIRSCNTAIEYDGIQHFMPQPFGGYGYDYEKAFEEQLVKDSIKDEYCKTNGIKLIRIPYTEIDKIREILDKQLA